MAQSAENTARESIECYNAGDFDRLRSHGAPSLVSRTRVAAASSLRRSKTFDDVDRVS